MTNTRHAYFPYFSLSVVKNCWNQTFVSLLGFLLCTVEMFWEKYLIQNIRLDWQSQSFEKKLLASLCLSFLWLSVCPSAHQNLTAGGRSFLKFLIAELRQNPSSKFKFGYNRTKPLYTYRPTHNYGYVG